jgi:hypothetical protein
MCGRQKQGIPKKTHEQFEKEVHTKNSNIKIIGQYTSSKEKISCECLICGHKWYTLPAQLLHRLTSDHNGCPECQKRKFMEGGKKTRFIKGQTPHNKTQ